MARTEIERTVRLSVLDRLLDDDPGVTREPAATFAQSVRAFRANVRRDLEWLLNARRPPIEIPEDFEELPRSVFTYGLPDITSMARDSLETRGQLLREVEEAIAHFEPRLTDVHVTLPDIEASGVNREVRFHVEATLRMDPNPERVVFDTVLELASGDFEVKGGGTGA